MFPHEMPGSFPRPASCWIVSRNVRHVVPLILDPRATICLGRRARRKMPYARYQAMAQVFGLIVGS